MSKISKETIWMTSSTFATVLPVVTYLIVSGHYNSVDSVYEVRGLVLGLLLFILATLILMTAACFRLKGWKKIVPIMGLLILIAVGFLAYNMYWFSAYK